MYYPVFLLLCALIGHVIEAVEYGHEDPSQNIFHNGGFEEEFTSDDWTTSSAVVERTTADKHSGSYSALVKDRTHKFGGLAQTINFGPENPLLLPHETYYVSMFIKFLDNATAPAYDMIRLMYRVYFDDSSLDYQGPCARIQYQFADDDWNQLGGDLPIPKNSRPATPKAIRFFLHVEPVSTRYYVDSFALTMIPKMGSDWKDVLQAKIETVRRRNVKIITTLPSGVQPAASSIEVNQVKPRFLWGPAVGENHFAGDNAIQTNLKLQMKKLFGWATFANAMKWRNMEGPRLNIRYNPVNRSVTWLVENGFKVRIHNFLWEIRQSNPHWLHSFHGDDLVDEMMRRIQYMLAAWKDAGYEWDMCNENVHNHYYEDESGHRDMMLLAQEFNYAHSLAPDERLCINEYRVLRDGQFTSATANLANKLKSHNVPIGCIGAQSHLRLGDSYDYDIATYMKRLEILSAADLPITITEFSLEVENITNRAIILDKILHAIYSQPKVEGLILWSWSNIRGLSFETNSHLVEGNNFTPNAAGLVFENLILNKWHSQYTYNPTGRTYTFTKPLYHGKYDLTLSVNGANDTVLKFEVEPGSGTQTVRLNF